MLRKLFSMSWVWGVGIFINIALAMLSFVSLDQSMLIFDLLCAVLCSVGYISSKYKEYT